MGKLVGWDIVGEEFAGIDVPIAKVTDSSVAITGCYGCRLCPLGGGGNDDRPRRCRRWNSSGCCSHLRMVSISQARPPETLTRVLEERIVVLVGFCGGCDVYVGAVLVLDPPGF